MAREDITFADIFKAIWRQANEDEVEGVFRLHILRFWSRERTIKFCLHLLGDEAQEWWASREAVEQMRAADVANASAQDEPEPGYLESLVQHIGERPLRR